MCGPTKNIGVSLPSPSEWPHRPILLIADDRVVDVDVSGHKTGQPLPLGKSIDFETELFKGRFYLRLQKNQPEHDTAGHAAYFDGKKRFYQLVIQGQFKADNLTFNDVVLGDVYERQLKGIPRSGPGKLVMKGMMKFVEALSPGIIFDVANDKQPKVLAPLGGCQTLSVDLPGQEPTDFDNLCENTKLIDGGGDGDFSSKEKRRKILSKPKTSAKYKIDSGLVYTFEAYDNSMDFATFYQHYYGGMKVDLVPSIDGQSLSLGVFTRNDLKCLFKFNLWHERALKEENKSNGK